MAEQPKWLEIMAFFFLDDSKQNAAGFSLAAFAVCNTDPQDELESILRTRGFDPTCFEYKSSARMKGNLRLQGLRDDLKQFIQRRCKVAVCVVDGDKHIGPASLDLLENTLTHERYYGQQHEVFFDEGLFSSKLAAETIAEERAGLQGCSFHFEQDSKMIAGIQVADLVAHTGGIMLLDALGRIDKLVKVQNSGYPEDTEIELGFELWAGLRYAFLGKSKEDTDDKFDAACMTVEPFGLFIHDKVKEEVNEAARKRFGEMYLGCIH